MGRCGRQDGSRRLRARDDDRSKRRPLTSADGRNVGNVTDHRTEPRESLEDEMIPPENK